MHTAIEIAKAVRAGQKSCRQIAEYSLARIAATNADINAFVYLDEAVGLAAADALDKRIADGEDPGLLAGVPFGIKDLRDSCAGMPMRNGSLITQDAAPDTTDSEHIARLKKAGAIPLGKLATAEFGLDGVTHTLLAGTTRNPWKLERTPSGSSGGSSAAVAAGMVPFATGGDGLGSIRCPAGFTGMVGLKPSLGRIPRADGFEDTFSPGAITSTVADTARYLDAVAGPDDRDRMSLPAPTVPYESLVESLAVQGLKVAWSVDLGFAPVEPEVAEICTQAMYRLVEAGDLVLTMDQCHFTNSYIPWNALAAVRLREKFEYLGYLSDRLEDISAGPRSFIERYAYQDSRQLHEYQQTVMQTEQEMAALFRDVDVLVTPTACCVPYAAEGPLPEVIDGRDASETNGEPFTALSSIAWNPSISVPAGVSSDGMPVGLLINVKRHRDDIALRLARISELANPWPLQAPGYDS